MCPVDVKETKYLNGNYAFVPFKSDLKVASAKFTATNVTFICILKKTIFNKIYQFFISLIYNKKFIFPYYCGF